MEGGRPPTLTPPGYGPDTLAMQPYSKPYPYGLVLWCLIAPQTCTPALYRPARGMGIGMTGFPRKANENLYPPIMVDTKEKQNNVTGFQRGWKQMLRDSHGVGRNRLAGGRGYRLLCGFQTLQNSYKDANLPYQRVAQKRESFQLQKIIYSIFSSFLVATWGSAPGPRWVDPKAAVVSRRGTC